MRLPFSYLDLAKEIGAIRGCALLNLFEIDATDMNLNMSTHASGLRDDLIKWQVNKINITSSLNIPLGLYYRTKSSLKFPYIFVQLKVDTNRKWNREICDQFDKMATRLGEIPILDIKSLKIGLINLN